MSRAQRRYVPLTTSAVKWEKINKINLKILGLLPNQGSEQKGLSEHRLTHSLLSMQNRQNLSQLSLRPLSKFGSKDQKIFWTQLFDLGWISYCLVSFMNEIFRIAQISQVPSYNTKICDRNKTEIAQQWSKQNSP